MCTKVKILILSCFQKMYSSEILDIDRNLDNHVKIMARADLDIKVDVWQEL